MTAAPSSLQTLVDFARLVSDATAPADVLPRLADALRDRVGAHGVAVVTLAENGEARVRELRDLPASVEALHPSAEALEEIGEAVRTAAGRAEGEMVCRPLVAAGNLFGCVVCFFSSSCARENTLELVDGLADLAAIAFEHAVQVERLRRSYAELRTSQELLARSEKLRALGQMAMGMSHDLRNILSPLSLHLQLAERATRRGGGEADGPAIAGSLAEMKRILTRGLETLDRLREYGRQSPEKPPELVDLDRLAHEAWEIAKPRLSSARSRARLEDGLGSPPPVHAVSGDVLNALVNLIVNAIDAMGPTGRFVALRSGRDEAGQSFVEVADDGPGIPPDVKRRIFEPFFTTKGQEGTGLGLAMVHACMQRHGGAVTVRTAPGQGTTFRLTFPAEPPPSRRATG